MIKHLPTAKVLTTWLADSDNNISFYYQKAQRLIQLNQKWRQQMDADLVAHVRIANIKDDCLVLEVNNSAWASRLHYQSSELLQHLSGWLGLEHITKIKWYIQPLSETRAPDQLQRTPPILSSPNKQLVSSLADSVRHPALKEALLKLSQVA